MARPEILACSECGREFEVPAGSPATECPACTAESASCVAQTMLTGDESAEHATFGDASAPEQTADIDRSGRSRAGAADDRPDSQIGRFTVRYALGRGAFGAVYLAFDPLLDREGAIKVPRFGDDNEDAQQRFLREAKAAAKLRHPNIVAVHETGRTDENSYIVSEFIDGTPLSAVIKKTREHRPELRQTVEWVRQIAEGLHYAHSEGIIHRDIKPANIMINSAGRPEIMDFGLAKRESEADVTVEGTILGTPAYMSPEQAKGHTKQIGPHSDQYSVGVVLYQLLTGRQPYEGETWSIMREACDPEISPPAPTSLFSDIPRDLEACCLKAMEYEPADRYPNLAAMAEDLEKWLDGRPLLARPLHPGERFIRWCRRNRTTAALSGTLLSLIITATIVGFISAFHFKELSEQSTRDAEAANTAKDAAEKARAVTEVQLHATRIKSSWADWQLGNVETAWKMLNDLQAEDAGWEGRFLRTEFAAARQTLYGHALWVVSLDASPDGRFIASACNDNTIRIRDAANGTNLHICEIPDTPGQVRFAPDSSTLACVDRANQITFWDASSGRLLKTVGPFSNDLTCLAFIEDGTKLVVGSDRRDTQGLGETPLKTAADQAIPIVRVLSTADGTVLAELRGHSQKITDVDGSADGTVIVSSSLDETIRIWRKDGDAYVPVNTLTAHAQGVRHVAISPNRDVVASCGNDLQIRLWDVESGKSLKSFVGHTAAVTGLAFSSNGKQIVSTSADKTARVWALTGEQLLTCKGHFDAVSEACFSSDDSRIFTASHDHTVKVWNARNNPSTLVVTPHEQVVWGADFSADGTKVVSGSQDGSIAIIDLHTGTFRNILNGRSASVMTITHSPVSDVFVVGDDQGRLRIFSSADGSLQQEIDAHVDYIWDASFSADGRLLATTGMDQTVRLWDTEEWSLRNKFVAHDQAITCVRFSSDRRFIVTAGDDRKVILWDAKTLERMHTFEGHQTPVWRAIFSPAGDVIASSSAGGEILLWDVASRRLIRTIDAHQSEIAGLAFSRDGSRLVSASDDQTIRVWNIEHGIELFVLRDKGDSEITHVSFSRDGTRLLSGNRGGITVRTGNNPDSTFRMFLPSDANKLCTDGMVAVTSSSATRADYQRELVSAQLCCRHYPSYTSLTVLGIAQYRLGDYESAIESLKTAQRIEQIKYGIADLRPNIEGYLALSYLRTGKMALASQVRTIFTRKASNSLFEDDLLTERLFEEVNREFNALAPADASTDER